MWFYLNDFNNFNKVLSGFYTGVLVVCNLGEKGEFPTPSKLCPSKFLKIYLVLTIILLEYNYTIACFLYGSKFKFIKKHRGLRMNIIVSSLSPT